MADFEDSNSPTWRNLSAAGESDRRYRGHDRVSRARTARSTASTTRSPRCSCGRAAGTFRRSTCSWTAPAPPARSWTSASTSSTTRAGWSTRARAPTSTSPRWSRTARRGWELGVRAGAGLARHPARHDQGHGVDRDDPRRVRDGGDPLRACATIGGLNAGRWDYMFSMIKCFRNRPEFVLAGPQQGHDDGAVHARLHRAAGEDMPPPRRARDGRDGRVHPEPPRPRDQRAGDRQVRDDKKREAGDGFDGTWWRTRTSCRSPPRSSTRAGRAAKPGGAPARRRSGERRAAPRRGLVPATTSPRRACAVT